MESDGFFWNRPLNQGIRSTYGTNHAHTTNVNIDMMMRSSTFPLRVWTHAERNIL